MQLDYLVNHDNLLNSVAQLGQLEFGYLNPGQTLEDRLKKLKLHLNTNSLPITFVAFHEGEFIGTTSLRVTDIHSYTQVSPWLGSVIIVPEKRNQGFGTLLVEETMKKAIQLGIDTWYLYTPNRESFYAKMGWKKIDLVTHNQTPGVVMKFDNSTLSTNP